MPRVNPPKASTAFSQDPKAKIECMMKLICPQEWGNLKSTDRKNVKHCQVCAKDVYYCGNADDLELAIQAKHCVAFPAKTVSRKTTVLLGEPAWLEVAPQPKKPQTLWQKISHFLFSKL